MRIPKSVLAIAVVLALVFAVFAFGPIDDLKDIIIKSKNDPRDDPIGDKDDPEDDYVPPDDNETDDGDDAPPLGTLHVRVVVSYMDGSQDVLSRDFSLLTVFAEGRAIQSVLYEAEFTPNLVTTVWGPGNSYLMVNTSGVLLGSTRTFKFDALERRDLPAGQRTLLISKQLTGSQIESGLMDGGYNLVWTVRLLLGFEAADGVSSNRLFYISYPTLGINVGTEVLPPPGGGNGGQPPRPLAIVALDSSARVREV